MPRSGYVAELRRTVGHDLLLLPSVMACIFDDDGRMLLLHHVDGGRWAPPGGAVEPDETPSEAVVRECREETGLVVRPAELLGVFGGPAYELVYDNGDRVQYVMTAFRCDVQGGHLAPDGVETTAARFVGPDERRDLELPRWAHDALPILFERHSPRVRAAATAASEPHGPLVVDEQRLVVEDGDLHGTGSWVYVWRGGGRVLHVGATGLPPAVRSWLHLHDDAPEVGRIRAQHPEALIGRFEVRAFRLADRLDRKQVRRTVLARLQGDEVPSGLSPEVIAAADEILERLGDTAAGPALRP